MAYSHLQKEARTWPAIPEPQSSCPRSGQVATATPCQALDGDGGFNGLQDTQAQRTVSAPDHAAVPSVDGKTRIQALGRWLVKPQNGTGPESSLPFSTMCLPTNQPEWPNGSGTIRTGPSTSPRPRLRRPIQSRTCSPDCHGKGSRMRSSIPWMNVSG